MQHNGHYDRTFEGGRSASLGYYVADFQYEEPNRHRSDDDGREWVLAVEDVKGFKTPLYRWKKRHVEAQYGIEIREITRK